MSVPAGTATVSYPPTWRPAAGDTGTATVVLRDRTGAVGGYLNITPREGAERLAGWPSFRIARNRDEGDTDVRALASATGLRFRAASGSCVIDDYRSRVGANAYREVACLVTGRRATDVLIAATALRDWSRLGSDAERAVASFIER